MTHTKLRLTTANTYSGKAMRDANSMELLLPRDDIPTVTAFQEIITCKKQATETIKRREYRALLLGSHGLAFALSPDIAVQDVQEVTYPSRRTGRRWGVHIIKFVFGQHQMIVGAGQGPVFCSSGWPSLAYRDAEVYGELTAKHPDDIVVSMGDRNFMTRSQRNTYNHHQAANWGARSLLPAAEPTYRLRAGKHRWIAWLGIMSDPQLDGISVRTPDQLELQEAENTEHLAPNQLGYAVETLRIASDHLAVRAQLQVPDPDSPSD